MKKTNMLYPVILTYMYGGHITLDIPEISVTIPVDDYQEAVELASFILNNEIQYAMEYGRSFPKPLSEEEVEAFLSGRSASRRVRLMEIVKVGIDLKAGYREAADGLKMVS